MKTNEIKVCIYKNADWEIPLTDPSNTRKKTYLRKLLSFRRDLYAARQRFDSKSQSFEFAKARNRTRVLTGHDLALWPAYEQGDGEVMFTFELTDAKRLSSGMVISPKCAFTCWTLPFVSVRTLAHFISRTGIVFTATCVDGILLLAWSKDFTKGMRMWRDDKHPGNLFWCGM